MKRILYIGIAALFFIFSACGEKDEVLFSDEHSYFSFSPISISVAENSESIKVMVEWAKAMKRSGTVEIEVVTEGVVQPAQEGVDYVLSTKTLTFSEDDYSQEIQIFPIDNDERTGNKTFILKLKENSTGDRIGSQQDANDRVVVTIVDDEHPLAVLLGEATLESLEPHRVQVVADESAEDVLWVHGLLTSPLKIIVTTVEDNYELSITLPQEGGVTDGYNSRYYGLYISGGDLFFTSGAITLKGITSKNNLNAAFDHGIYGVGLTSSDEIAKNILVLYPSTIVLKK